MYLQYSCRPAARRKWRQVSFPHAGLKASLSLLRGVLPTSRLFSRYLMLYFCSITNDSWNFIFWKMHVERTKEEQSNLQHVYLLFFIASLMQSPHQASRSIFHVSSLLHQTTQAPMNTAHLGSIPARIPIHLSSQGDTKQAQQCVALLGQYTCWLLP